MSPLPLTDSVRRVLERVKYSKPLQTICDRCNATFDQILQTACTACGSDRLWVYFDPSKDPRQSALQSRDEGQEVR